MSQSVYYKYQYGEKIIIMKIFVSYRLKEVLVWCLQFETKIFGIKFGIGIWNLGICSGTSTEWLFVHWNLDRIRIWKCWFLRRGENQSTRRKTSRSREEKQQQTQPTYCVESENRSRATSVGDECSHHCAIPAPRMMSESMNKLV